MKLRKPRACTSRNALCFTPYHSAPNFSRCAPRVHVAVSVSWKVSEVLDCGLLYSGPSGENPEMEMRLSPASRGLLESAGRPTLALVIDVSDGNTSMLTRL